MYEIDEIPIFRAKISPVRHIFVKMGDSSGLLAHVKHTSINRELVYYSRLSGSWELEILGRLDRIEMDICPNSIFWWKYGGATHQTSGAIDLRWEKIGACKVDKRTCFSEVDSVFVSHNILPNDRDYCRDGW